MFTTGRLKTFQTAFFMNLHARCLHLYFQATAVRAKPTQCKFLQTLSAKRIMRARPNN
jgi:hypothetical protein